MPPYAPILPLLLLLLLLLPPLLPAQRIVNPVRTPPTNTSRPVIIRKFAQLPRFRNRPQPIVSTTPFRTSLYIVVNTNGHIYRVRPSGAVDLWFNVNTTFFAVTGRSLNFDRFLHGGLRSVAFHPRFSQNRLVYTAHVETRTPGRTYLSTPPVPTNVDSVVGEWRVGEDGNVVGGSYREVLRIGMPVYDHTIREMRFRGRYMYVGTGDGAAQNNTLGGGQNADGLGKILRINPLRQPDGSAYAVPRSNPFRGRASDMLPEVWALGFRNPHNLCFGRRGELFAVDVGRDNVEEVNIVTRGGNYGWSRREGLFVHLEGDGGIMTGVRRRLPPDDARFGFTYPAAVVGHFGERGAGFVFQALTGSCPIQNGSPLDGVMLYANFPGDGQMYFSNLEDLREAVTRGRPRQLTQATTFVPRLFFQKREGAETVTVAVENLREIVRMDEDFSEVARTDARFGQGRRGEIYWTSKQNGAVYVVVNSVPTPRRKMVLSGARRVVF